ncbi:unnamed protein product [Rotaria sp. Silwood2]|nr:unnamed protein product [Rotaria sp. Silwood2]CAF2630589.1 unnamed protein product [Rotaria sp. Silwood2]CAF3069229.1 unnamed protein product [Rotaria sp. Silwood2]CAF3922217.1 unnamed protein product [Rotaria sp. Silwood2]CAF3968597.1 unnamed protein product [Rotaria sp. Silwood2]
MCYYCCYLTHVNSSSSSSNIHDNNQYFPYHFKRRCMRSYNVTISLCLVSLTLFFVMLNITLVLSQSSQTQQQQQQSSNKILQQNSRDIFGVNTGIDKHQHQEKYHHYVSLSLSSNPTNSNSAIHPPKTKRLTHEKRLIRDLLNNYPTIYARPIRNVSEPITISFGLTLIQLFDLGSTGQTMQTNTWKTLIWQDMNLVWNPADYGGLATVCLPADSIWTPDVVLYNYADERLKDWREISAVIQHTGDILYVPATMQFSVCFLDITKFPYDIHQCSLTYRSWTYDFSKVILSFKEDIPAMDMTSYLNSNEWKVMPLEAKRTITNDRFSLLTFTMIIQRKGGLYGYILILPCLLLSAATMVVFWIPPESPAKMILTISIFSGLFLLLLLLAESIPGGGGTPHIGYYYCVNMVVVSVTAVLATIVIHVYVRGDRRQGVPPYIHRLFLQYLARLYCMAPKTVPNLSGSASSRYGSPLPGALLLPEKIFLTPRYHEEEFSKKLKLLKQRFHEFHRQQELKQQQKQPKQSSLVFNAMTNETIAALSVNLRSIENDLKEIRDYLRHMKKKIEDTDRSNKTADDWKQVALVLDRTFFFAYCGWLILSLIVMFPKTPNISKGTWSTPTLTPLTNVTNNISNLTLI